MTFVNSIQKWFGVEFGGSLYLPDGWFGRPYDNQHILTAISETEDSLIITLDHKIVLCFEGLRAVDATSRELVLGPFTKLRFEWEDAKGGQRVTKEYESGVAKIVAAPG